ncbi:MAG: class I SAM-dependent methyltransferase [Proteobacteria bacterium]|nr:class I SAM-dependent methyltransferase [Pseudomonadota bacterium]
MKNPWLAIPLADSEGHMSLPAVGQARMLADVFESLLHEFLPKSVAVIGCAGGNGFERISPDVTTRVIGVDINPTYIEKSCARFAARLQGLELHSGDVQSDKLIFEPVNLIYAALVFEYVNPAATLVRLASLLKPGGILATLVQLHHMEAEAVTPSQYHSLQPLSAFMRIMPPEELRTIAESTGFDLIASCRIDLPSGKAFQAQRFRL